MESIRIVLVEDDMGHVHLIEKNLRRVGITNEIVSINNGQEAIDYLAENTSAQGTTAKIIILLDLNLPVLNGFEVLERIRSDGKTKKIPVIILTTTDNPYEITKCYELGCNIFITKPVQYDEFCTVIRNLGLLMSIIKIP